jgi:Tetratricopeptide repeat
MANLAFTWKKQGRDVEAVGLMKEYVGLQRQILGADHPHFTCPQTGWRDVWQRAKRGAKTGSVAEGQERSTRLNKSQCTDR